MLPCFLDLSDGFQHESGAIPRKLCSLWVLFRPLGMMNKEMPLQYMLYVTIFSTLKKKDLI